MKFVKWLKELSKKDLPLVGGKAANLGEMYNAGLPVPQAFVVTVDAYKEFLKITKLKGKIFNILKETDFNNPANLEENTKKIRELIENAKMPEEIEKEIIDAYEELSKEFVKEEEYVAVRSSATAEDIVGASFAGLQLTLLNIKGKENVVKAVKKCWASLFTPRATFYRHQKGFKHEKVYIAIPVQKQLGVLSKDEYLQGKYKAGIGFTIHPVTGEKNKIVVEASYGQGEAVVSGEVNPDTYVIDKESGKVLEAHIGTKEKMKITKEGGELEEVEVPENMRKVLCLSEDEIKQLWNLARKLEEHYQFPQDFEWASENGKVYLVQSRPVTVFYEKKEAKIIVEKPPILKGLPASPGVAIGRVKVCLTIEEAKQKLEKGDILVTRMTSPDWTPFMKIASGIITSEGGLTSHCAIVSRELGIPCIVGASNALEVLKDGMMITLDSRNGVVYEGRN
jgi:pyruvate, water dikinase